MSNIQTLTSHDTKSSLALLISLPTVDSTSKTIVFGMEEAKEKEVSQKEAKQEQNLQKLQNFVDNINQSI